MNFEDLMETIRNIQKTFLNEIRVCEKPTKEQLIVIFFNLVFLFRCLNSVTDLNVHDFVSFFFILRTSPRKGSWGAARARPIGSTTFYVCFALSIIVLAVSYTFDFYRVLYYCTSII